MQAKRLAVECALGRLGEGHRLGYGSNGVRVVQVAGEFLDVQHGLDGISVLAAEVQRHAQQPGLERNDFALEPVGVALAVPILVVGTDDGLGLLEHRVWLEHLDGMVRVLLDDFHLVSVALFRVAQPAPDDRAIHAGDRDVVQRRRARTFFFNRHFKWPNARPEPKSEKIKPREARFVPWEPVRADFLAAWPRGR